LASVVAVGGSVGTTFTLTAGADTIVGAGTNDVINALSINAAGTNASTLTGFDSIDGGAGNDTLNIFTKTGFNDGAFPSNVTVKNVETINYNNSNNGVAINASHFVGATAINQIGATAGTVTELAAGTVAGFNGVTGGTILLETAAAAATANVALTNVSEGLSVVAVSGNGTGGVLNSVTVTGNVVDAGAKDGVIDNIGLQVVAGKDVESVTVNTAVGSTLSVGNVVSGKTVSTVDASASTGSITYNAEDTVASIKTGSGKDDVTLNTALTATAKTASVSTGDGIDTLYIQATAAASSAATVAVDAGAGNDTINLAINSDITYNVAAGAGDDTVVITGTVKTTDKIDGGAGTDTVSLALAGPKTLVADDYIVFNKVLTNFETLQLTGKAATMDASLLGAGYTTIDLATGSVVSKVGAQALIANGKLDATAAGTDLTATPKVYAGTLNITKVAGSTVGTDDAIIAKADKVALTVDASKANVTADLQGDAHSASVTLVQALNTDKSGYVGAAAFSLTTGMGDANLAGLTLAGNGTALVDNVGGKLVNVDASALNSVDFAGKATFGLNYVSGNAAAETIKLGAGLDTVTLNASTYGTDLAHSTMDTVTGLNLVASSADAKVADFAKSDSLIIAGVTSVIKFTTAQTDLGLALKDAAAFSADHSGANLVFQQGGNTYVFHDAGDSSAAGHGLIDGADTVVQLTGQVNLDLLSSVLHNVA
jgi:hypothetical protein